jgi:hypothetical protein
VRLTALLLLAGCATAPGAVEAALSASTAAVMAMPAHRAAYGCFTSCPVGTTCNRATGLCDRPGCNARCGRNEVCVKSGFFEEYCQPTTRVFVPARRDSSSERSRDFP